MMRDLEAVRAGLEMPLVEAMSTQRSIRRVLDEPVDDGIVLRCIELALKAPTGSNGQNWEFVVVRDPEVKAGIAAQYRRAWPLYRRLGHRLVGVAADEKLDRMHAAVTWQVEHFEELPVLVVACLRGGRAPLLPSPKIALSSYYGSIYPSVQNLLLGARAMGLGASLITLPLWSSVWSRHLLGLPVSVTPVCLVALGWPQGGYGPTTRKPVGEVVHLDRYGNQPYR